MRRLLDRLLETPDAIARWRLAANAALLVASFWLGWRFFLMSVPRWEMGSTFLHGAMLPFHEFGHILFSPFGEFMTLLGGSLAQVLLPLGFLLMFVIKNRDNFAASLMLWWAGTQLIDIAPYVYDAKAPQHVLLTGRTGDTGAHDFIDVLFDLGLLDHAHAVAWVVHKSGLMLMIAAWAWGAILLFRQWRVSLSDS